MLNAKQHEREAHIIAQAGRPGTVTIATNMAGRGTDIVLGGNLEAELHALPEDTSELARAEVRAAWQKRHDAVIGAGGLHIIGTERHESRRIDNQLRGRSGRQGDPGASRFFLSLEDDLMRIFGSERMDSMLQRFGLKEGEAIVHPWVNKALEKAQQKVEARNFDIRKNILKYDNIMNNQRKVIYEQRRDLMRAVDVSQTVAEMRHDVIDALVTRFMPPNAYAEQWDTKGLHEESVRVLGLDLPLVEWAKEEGIDDEAIRERLNEAADRRMAEKTANFGPDIMRMAEKSLLLQLLDQDWKDHLLTLDHLRQGIQLRAYGQRDPFNEYSREAFEMFQAMLGRLREQVTALLSHVEIRRAEPEQAAPPPPRPVTMRETRRDPALAPVGANGYDELDRGPMASTMVRRTATAFDQGDPSTWARTPRNAPCPCGSGKKYKQCHGKAG